MEYLDMFEVFNCCCIWKFVGFSDKMDSDEQIIESEIMNLRYSAMGVKLK